MRERIHMIGIGGIGMSALAQLLLARGVSITGSDLVDSPLLRKLEALGARVSVGHRAEYVDGATRAVTTDAAHEDNPEVLRAQALGLPMQRRSELLAELAAHYRLIAVSGTHGKTTVTAMIGHILMEAGLDPTIVLGGEYAPIGGNARVGHGEWMVVEACEAYESFLDLHPEIAVVTNIEADHLDHHGTEQHLRESFRQFLLQVKPNGTVVLCRDRSELRSLAESVSAPVIWYGTEAEASLRGTDITLHALGGTCRLWVNGQAAGDLQIGVPVAHNLVNALGALAASRLAGATVEAGRRALAEFHGVGRRFEVLGEVDGVVFVDDYAHHPTEIENNLLAARTAFPGRRVVAVFQPHLYSRTRDFAADFVRALSHADAIGLLDIYPAREAPIPGVTLALLSTPLRKIRGEDAVFEVAKENMVDEIIRFTRAGDVVLVMGAGDISDVIRRTYQALRARAGAPASET